MDIERTPKEHNKNFGGEVIRHNYYILKKNALNTKR
jgi:hypothetical protein